MIVLQHTATTEINKMTYTFSTPDELPIERCRQTSGYTQMSRQLREKGADKIDNWINPDEQTQEQRQTDTRISPDEQTQDQRQTDCWINPDERTHGQRQKNTRKKQDKQTKDE